MADELLPAEERARQLLTEIWGYPRNSDDAAVAAYIIREERQAAFKECEQIVRNFAWMLPKYDSWEVNDATNDAAQSVSQAVRQCNCVLATGEGRSRRVRQRQAAGRF